MQLNTPDAVSLRIDDLRTRLKAILGARDAAATALGTARDEANDTLRKGIAAAKSEFDAGTRQVSEASQQARETIDARHARNLDRIESALARAAGRAEEGLAGEREQVRTEMQRARVEAAGRVGGSTLSASLSEIESLLELARGVQEKVAAFAKTIRVPLADLSEAAPPAGIAGAKVAGTARQRLDETTKILASRRRAFWLPFARTSRRVVLAFSVLLLHGAAALAVVQFRPDDYQTALQVVAVSGIGCLIASMLFGAMIKQGAAGTIESLWAGVAATDALLRHRETALKDAILREQEKHEAGQARALSGTEERLSTREREADRTHKTRIEILEDQRAGAIRRSEGHRDRRLALQAQNLARDTKRLADWHARAVGRFESVQSERVKEIAERERREMEELVRQWSPLLESFYAMAAKSRDANRSSWSAPANVVFPDGVRLGDVTFDLKTLAPPPADDPRFAYAADGAVALPLDLAFPDVGRVLFNADGTTRDRALAALLGTVLRILCTLPPGKAKFTLIDPVGLGQSFSALMHLADFDETLVGSRIWTEPAHIEKRLAELTEHIEKVIQKYLRNRYHSIDEYNREVGPMAEAYRFLVVADFPTGFSELALERLASIARSGARCGVILLILRDTRQKLPAAADRATLESGGLTIDVVDRGFIAREKAVGEGLLSIDALPAPAALNTLLQDVGRQCADAKRVEIPFEIIVPKAAEMWSLTSTNGIRIPLGRAGADRLQHLDLGRGTAQHALIAGRTGSGKSTLFHAIITNAALWYSPREAEFYLIDFKKGVEFKTYAVNGLPQARVIAIESDREFGVSVLRRVYAELGRRAEKFRAAGVQDVSGYRKAVPTEPLARTLLMIDEFQEFFTEEDAIAQEAALLLDRIVRQGRAFGVHVILGSQTLGGSYTLAKSTLGQMAVRIALPCSEADSYLILSDDNAAARLLSRPGEAIYNDKSGAIEGNDPFQIAWLPDEVRDEKLKLVRERALSEGLRNPEPTTVFEGNVPADIRNNRLLAERLARPGAGDPCAWIGEANAIKGPTEIRFKPQRGCNVLIVGQQRESALSILCSAMISLASAHKPGGARFVVLDGSPPDLGHGRHFAELAKALKQPIEIVDYARVAPVMAELDAEVAARLEGGRASPQIFLAIHDLQTFRKLRQGDELDFSSAEEKKRTPEKCFANILGEGPALGIHTIAWCDSLSNINRMLTRRLLKEFDVRVLFQMSATDSSELIDSPAAGKLGLYRGLLFLEEEGTTEKFRPYGLPDLETLRAIGQETQRA